MGPTTLLTSEQAGESSSSSSSSSSGVLFVYQVGSFKVVDGWVLSGATGRLMANADAVELESG
eukprot:CAMPEP_0195028044 /NCGR_PEP_ID=MMETSP0326_2-20130528/53589_1 /TAXON_ID=2866 ORGANISM="Crypthecodinium cohnii, Strain Seligo" /NCGR_SAMPLE_ID=MMETSP0326_2 /ASSEMBLY_ACC=CAM_ASM_000348 /LENGTH=62 /DNA_ID=CAMNT_0040050439 /DNA_START=43 /DNA_END=231 /DNA_ORIENTATION=-